MGVAGAAGNRWPCSPASCWLLAAPCRHHTLTTEPPPTPPPQRVKWALCVSVPVWFGYGFARDPANLEWVKRTVRAGVCSASGVGHHATGWLGHHLSHSAPAAGAVSQPARRFTSGRHSRLRCCSCGGHWCQQRDAAANPAGKSLTPATPALSANTHTHNSFQALRASGRATAATSSTRSRTNSTASCWRSSWTARCRSCGAKRRQQQPEQSSSRVSSSV